MCFSSEYWISHDDKSYNNLMSGVSEYIKNPGVKDVPVHEVFTEVITYIIFLQ